MNKLPIKTLIFLISLLCLNSSFFATSISGNLYPNKGCIYELTPPKVYAVIVGISDYEGTTSDLRYSSVDAELFYNNLKSAMPTECALGDVRLLLNSQATATTVEQTITEVFLKATKSDYVIFFFSGHGSKDGHFTPYDFHTSQIAHTFVRDKFFESNAKYKVCFADACFSGDLVNQSGATSNLEGDKIALLMSSKSYQTSIETSSIEQGYFTYYLIKGMKGEADKSGDKYVTLAELFLYVKEEVSVATKNEQIPVVFGSNLNKIPISRIR